MLLGSHFVYSFIHLFRPVLKADTHHSKEKGKKSAAHELFLQGFQLSLSTATHPRGTGETKSSKILSLLKSNKIRCSQPMSEEIRSIPALGICFFEEFFRKEIEEILEVIFIRIYF